MLAGIVFGLGLLFLLWLLVEPGLRAWRRARLRRRPFPAAWRDMLRRHVPAVRALPADLQLKLKQHIQVFLAEKQFVGCDGLQITDEMRLTIAAQACLLLLNRPGGYYPKLHQILVYPAPFIVDKTQTDALGLQHAQRQVLSGESWSHGQIVLAWDETQAGAAEANDGRNLVIHEFAHQLDQEKGQATGIPLFAGRAQRQRWARVMQDEFSQLQARIARGEAGLLDPYGATNPAEFFAVISETFFERPHDMAAQHPALYRELSGYYRLNPLSWA